MGVDFTGRNLPVTADLLQLARVRTERLERHLGGSAQVHVILTHEKHRFGAEIIATHRRRCWKAQEETADPKGAIALAFAKIDAQAKKDSERLHDRKHRAGGTAASKRRVPERESGPGETAATPLIERRVIRSTQRSPVKPMSVEEAALRMDGSRQEFLVFRDSGDEKISILYKRRDGDFGLIVPEC